MNNNFFGGRVMTVEEDIIDISKSPIVIHLNIDNLIKLVIFLNDDNIPFDINWNVKIDNPKDLDSKGKEIICNQVDGLKNSWKKKGPKTKNKKKLILKNETKEILKPGLIELLKYKIKELSNKNTKSSERDNLIEEIKRGINAFDLFKD